MSIYNFLNTDKQTLYTVLFTHSHVVGYKKRGFRPAVGSPFRCFKH